MDADGSFSDNEHVVGGSSYDTGRQAMEVEVEGGEEG